MFIPQQSFVFINHEEEAHQYITPPNTTTLLMCRNAPYFFIKASDSLGQYTIDRYEFKKAPQSPQHALPDNLVTLDQFNQFKDEIRALLTPQEVTQNESTKK